MTFYFYIFILIRIHFQTMNFTCFYKNSWSNLLFGIGLHGAVYPVCVAGHTRIDHWDTTAKYDSKGCNAIHKPLVSKFAGHRSPTVTLQQEDIIFTNQRQIDFRHFESESSQKQAIHKLFFITIITSSA